VTAAKVDRRCGNVDADARRKRQHRRRRPSTSALTYARPRRERTSSDPRGRSSGRALGRRSAACGFPIEAPAPDAS
jgi:hypothetical protein